MTGASEDEAREFARVFRAFLEWMGSGLDRERPRNEVVALVQDFLAGDALAQSVVSRSLPVFEHVNLQTALDAWMAEPGRSVSVHGISVPPHYGPVNLSQLLSGEAMPPLRPPAPPLLALPNGPPSTLGCFLLAA